MDQKKAPIYDRMLEHRSLGTTSFHVPGHKAGVGLDPLAIDILQTVMSIDLTELTGLDDLHQPEGIIREAEQLAAGCFGADHTFLLVGGSTVGNLAMILSLCEKGRENLIIVQRNVHKSIIHGLMLAGAQAVFLTPQVDGATGIAAGLALCDIEAAIRQYPSAVGVLLTNPNYYGMGIELDAIIDCVHAQGKPVLVDEAHGAHYGFHPDVPRSALAAGADGVVQSTHKMLTAMTMGAMLHLQGNRIDPSSVRRHLSILQSSSPSYPILASLDLSRRQLHLHGRSLLDKALEAVYRLHQGMRQMPWYQLVELDTSTQAYNTLDPLKLTLSDRTGTLGGFELQHQLEQHRCYPEMADPNNVVLAFSIATREQDMDRLLHVLLTISTEFSLDKQQLAGPAEFAKIRCAFEYPTISLPVQFALYTNQPTDLAPPLMTLEVSIEEAVGHVAKQVITPYPPGIPILYPGERVSAETAQQLRVWVRSGARIHGLTKNGNMLVN